MRMFHVKVFDDSIEGTTPVYSGSEFEEQLASVTSYTILVVTSNVSGTSPTLTVVHEESADRVRWFAPDPAEINAAALTPGAVEINGSSTDPKPGSGFNRLKISLGGTSPKARVTVWVTGHDTLR